MSKAISKSWNRRDGTRGDTNPLATVAYAAVVTDQVHERGESKPVL